MKKTLLCLAIGILSFYVGNFAHNLVYWDSFNPQLMKESETCNFDISKNIDEQDILNENVSKKYLSIPLEGGSWGYYYNLPASKGKHAPDFYWEGSFMVRKYPSPIELQSFEFDLVSFDENMFSFRTIEIDGIRYSMEGKMPNEKNGFTIKGSLTKYKNGAIVFRRKVVFRESIPDC